MKFLIFSSVIFLFFMGAVKSQGGESLDDGVSGPIDGGPGPAPETDCEAIEMLLEVQSECIAGWPILSEGGITGSCQMFSGNERWNAMLDAVRSEAVLCFEGCSDDISQGGEAFEDCKEKVKEADQCLTEKMEEAQRRLCG